MIAEYLTDFRYAVKLGIKEIELTPCTAAQAHHGIDRDEQFK